MFTKGDVNINREGRPRLDPEVLKILKAAIPEAAKKLVDLTNSKSEKVRLEAIEAIFNRVHGKPRQQMEIDNEGGLPFTIIIQKNDQSSKSS